MNPPPSSRVTKITISSISDGGVDKVLFVPVAPITEPPSEVLRAIERFGSASWVAGFEAGLRCATEGSRND